MEEGRLGLGGWVSTSSCRWTDGKKKQKATEQRKKKDNPLSNNVDYPRKKGGDKKEESKSKRGGERFERKVSGYLERRVIPSLRGGSKCQQKRGPLSWGDSKVFQRKKKLTEKKKKKKKKKKNVNNSKAPSWGCKKDQEGERWRVPYNLAQGDLALHEIASMVAAGISASAEPGLPRMIGAGPEISWNFFRGLEKVHILEGGLPLGW